MLVVQLGASRFTLQKSKPGMQWCVALRLYERACQFCSEIYYFRMERKTKLSPAELASYTREILGSLSLVPLEIGSEKKPAKMRGVEFYGQHFPEILMECLFRYYNHNKTLPDPPLQCKSLREKIFWSKFYVPLPIPTPADKLSVGNFIPGDMRGKVKTPKVHWISASADNLPASIKAPKGHYFLKSNHGWRGMKRVEFPLAQAKMEGLRQEAASWLARENYNLRGGEWWYSTISPKIYIETEVKSQNGPAPEYKFTCAGGKVVSIYHPVYEHMHAATQALFYPDFRWRDGVLTHLPNVEAATPKDAKLLILVAEAIASQFELVRVDLYNPSPGIVILGELTLCPNAGIIGYTPESFEHELGAYWDMNQYFL